MDNNKLKFCIKNGLKRPKSVTYGASNSLGNQYVLLDLISGNPVGSRINEQNYIRSQGHHRVSESFCLSSVLLGGNSQKRGSTSCSPPCLACSFGLFFQRCHFG